MAIVAYFIFADKPTLSKDETILVAFCITFPGIILVLQILSRLIKSLTEGFGSWAEALEKMNSDLRSQ